MKAPIRFLFLPGGPWREILFCHQTKGRKKWNSEHQIFCGGSHFFGDNKDSEISNFQIRSLRGGLQREKLIPEGYILFLLQQLQNMIFWLTFFWSVIRSWGVTTARLEKNGHIRGISPNRTHRCTIGAGSASPKVAVDMGLGQLWLISRSENKIKKLEFDLFWFVGWT